MISLTVERRYGTTTVRARITAPSIERALELCGGNANVVFPVESESLFPPKDAAEAVEELPAGASERHAEVAA